MVIMSAASRVPPRKLTLIPAPIQTLDDWYVSWLWRRQTKTPKYAIMVRVDDANNGGFSGSSAAQPIFDAMSNFMIQYEGVSK